MLICFSCAGSMTEDEARYYGECEECARETWERLRRWRLGTPDAELEELSAEPRVLH